MDATTIDQDQRLREDLTQTASASIRELLDHGYDIELANAVGSKRAAELIRAALGNDEPEKARP